jgi:signal transduction histidine kinase
VALPSFAALGVAWIAPGKGWVNERFVKALLAAVIAAQTAETLISRLLYRAYLPQPILAEIAARLGQAPIEALAQTSMPLRLGVPLLFIAVAAILGAWISGRRGALRWVLYGSAMGLAGILPLTAPDVTQFRLYIGILGAQVIVMSIACYFVGSLADQQRAEQAELREANRQLAEQARVREQLATARERMRLSRDLHDTLAHTLAGLSVQLRVVDGLVLQDPPAARQELARAQTAARQGLDETRAAIADLRVNLVQDLGLGGALRRQAELVGQRAGIAARFEQRGEEPALDAERAEALFRIAQEALNNVERHSRATRATVSLSSGPGGVSIAVEDDGVGFDVDALGDERFGLRGMRERAAQAGALLRVESAAGKGTRVTVTCGA